MDPCRRWRGFAAFGLIAVLVLCDGGAAQAHHSFAMFDRSKTLTIKGTVKAWEFGAPHSWLHIVTQDASGHEVQWSFEGRAPSGSPLRHDTFRIGDKVTVLTHPVRDGRPAGDIDEVILADGRIVSERPPNYKP